MTVSTFVISADLGWKGLYQASHYFMYEDIAEGNYYVLPGETIDIRSLYMVEMTPVIRISDGLKFESTISFSRLFLDEETGGIANSGSRYLDGTRMKGRPTGGTDSSLGAELQRFYGVADFENVSVYVGRVPYNFGLGMTYSDGLSYKALTYNVQDVLAAKFRLNDDIYIKTGLSFNGVNKIDLVLEGGYKKDDYGVAVLVDEAIYGASERSKGNVLTGYMTHTHDQTYYPGTLNVYGYYKVSDDLQLALEAGSYLDDWIPDGEHFGAIIDVFWNTGISNSYVNIMAAYATADYDLNPNWTPVNALLDYRIYSNATNDVERGNVASMAFTNGVAITGIVGEHLDENNDLSLLYAYMNDNMHEVLLIHTFKTNKGFYWDNFLGFVLTGPNGELSFNKLPVLQAMTRLAYVF